MTGDRWTLSILKGARDRAVPPRHARFGLGALAAVVLGVSGTSFAAVWWGVDRLGPRAGEAGAADPAPTMYELTRGDRGSLLAARRDRLQATPSILPAAGPLSSRFALSRWHPVHDKPLPHEGVDIAAASGSPIIATARGQVVRAGWAAGYGQLVEIDHGFGYVTRYAHASRLLVRVGQEVERGDAVARVGSTGIATSSHVHYEVIVNGQPRNPLHYVFDDSSS